MAVNKDKLAELDSHWKEVMELAEKYGFITQAYGGVAELATHKNQIDSFGEQAYIQRQEQMFGNYMEVLQ